MNWYKMANKFQNVWIDPNGKIFTVEFPHDHYTWQQANKDMIQKEYEVDVKEEDLVTNNWIKIRFWIQYQKIAITIKNIFDDSTIKRIGDFLWSSLEIDRCITIEIEDVNGKRSSFEWQDFIESGENFNNFVQSGVNFQW
jgi:hypothetical protein